MFLEAAAIDGPDPAVDTINTELIRAEKDNRPMSFMGGECCCVIPGLVAAVENPDGTVPGRPVSGRDFSKRREECGPQDKLV